MTMSKKKTSVSLTEAFKRPSEKIKIKPVRARELICTAYIQEYQIDFAHLETDRFETYALLVFSGTTLELRVPMTHSLDASVHVRKREIEFTPGLPFSFEKDLTEMLAAEGYEVDWKPAEPEMVLSEKENFSQSN